MPSVSLSQSEQSELLTATSRVALAAMLHDIGKVAERARIEVDRDRLNTHKNIYCPHFQGRPSHIHAAYSALAIEELEALLPELSGEDMMPFASWGTGDADDSLLNAAAKHHRPETFLQWIVATADRAASGLDRETFDEYNQKGSGRNHYTTRQWSLFEQIRRRADAPRRMEPELRAPKWRYRLQKLTPASIFPVAAEGYEGADNYVAQTEYRALWNDFKRALQRIPLSHTRNLPLWLDHFDSLWMIFTHAIPASTFKTEPDVSLYDHSKAVTALATALWRYHYERGDPPVAACAAMEARADWDVPKLLMVQGDLFGIQDFIFAAGGQTEKHAARLLRGRSFYVSLLAECAALRILDSLALPPTSQITNAGGRFLLVAPNTHRTREILHRVRKKLDAWFLRHTYGQAGIGLAWEPACCSDLQSGGREESPYRDLTDRLFASLEEAKLRRFDLCDAASPPAVFRKYLAQFDNSEPCQIDGRLPAETEYGELKVSRLTRDQIALGRALTRQEHSDTLVISRTAWPSRGLHLSIPIFGFQVCMDQHAALTGADTSSSAVGALLRGWDIALPQPDSDASLWRGWARRFVNSYVPYFAEESSPARFKDFNELAKQALVSASDGNAPRGVAGLMTIKGDIDDLGVIFRDGLKNRSISRTAALSRQINAFFAVYLPWLCQCEFKETYTVFAGGDDFFLIGPWPQQQELVQRVRKDFHRYVGEHPDIHFSAGLVMTKPGVPVRYLARRGEKALEEAKNYGIGAGRQSKNAITSFGRTVSWDRFHQLMKLFHDMYDHPFLSKSSYGYKYRLLELVEMQENMARAPQNARWRSLFTYHTWRMLESKYGLTPQERQKWYDSIAQILIEQGIDCHGGDFRVALFPYLYSQREANNQ